MLSRTIACMDELTLPSLVLEVSVVDMNYSSNTGFRD